MCRFLGKLNDAESKVESKLREDVKQAILDRNDIAHGDWWIGLITDVPDEIEPPSLIRIKPVRSEGYEQELAWGAADLDKKSNELRKLVNLIFEYGHLCLGLPVVYVDANGQTQSSVGEFRLGDVFVAYGGGRGKNAKPVEIRRDGPKAASVKQMNWV